MPSCSDRHYWSNGKLWTLPQQPLYNVYCIATCCSINWLKLEPCVGSALCDAQRYFLGSYLSQPSLPIRYIDTLYDVVSNQTNAAIKSVIELVSLH